MSTQQTLNQSNVEGTIICYAPNMITTNGIWQGDNPLDYSLPLFILQLTLIVTVTRILVYLLKPFRQPRVIAEILVSFPFSTFFYYYYYYYHIFFSYDFIFYLIIINMTGWSNTGALSTRTNPFI